MTYDAPSAYDTSAAYNAAATAGGGGGGGVRRTDADLPGSGSGSGSSGGGPGWYYRIEYTTFEFDADDEEAICDMAQACCDLLSGGSGASGSGSTGSGTITIDNGPYNGPCTCPPGYVLVPVAIDTPNGPLVVTRCKGPFGNIILCNEDPANGGGGNPSGGGGNPSGNAGGVPRVVVELTTFDVPANVTIVSKRIANVFPGDCGPCP